MLLSETRKPKIAEKDIPIWKVFLVDEETGPEVIFTPTVGYIIRRLPTTMVGECRFTKGRPIPYEGKYIISEGFIHCHTIKREAYADAGNAQGNRNKPWNKCWDYRIVQGYIPQGTEYYQDGEYVCARVVELTKCDYSYYYY